MFVLTTIADTIRVPPSLFLQPTLDSIHQEIDKKYPNRVILDVGLVICRFGDVTEFSEGICAPGDGAAFYEVIFQLIVFKPLVDEVCVGTIVESNEFGIRISLGEFFEDIIVPDYWMLKPSHYDHKLGLWKWTPKYDDDDNNESQQEGGNTTTEAIQQEDDGFEMPLGSDLRFRVKSIDFTQVTSSAKGRQATTTTTTTTTTSTMSSNVKASSLGKIDTINFPVRKRSTSVDLTDVQKTPACMQIQASICEDGLGLISWWITQSNEENVEDTMNEDHPTQFEEDYEMDTQDDTYVP